MLKTYPGYWSLLATDSCLKWLALFYDTRHAFLTLTIGNSTILTLICISAHDDMLGIPCLPAQEAWRGACQTAV